MSENNKKLVHRVYSIIMSVSLIALAILFIINAIALFSSGGDIASSEKVLSGDDVRDLIGKRLMNMLIPIIITVLLVIAGPFLDIFIPQEVESEKVIRDPYRVLNIMLRKHKCSLYTEEGARAIHKERKFRLYFTLGGIALFLLSIIYPLIAMLSNNAVSAAGNANTEVLEIMLVLLIFLIPTVVYSIVIGILFDKSMLREYELIKRGISAEKCDGEGYITLKDYSARGFIGSFISTDLSKILKLSYIALISVLAVVFIILGIINGGMTDVLNKAVNICRECIGLG